jgi:peptidoglycan hydrolase-like protein with peptidoglycan-binding domain
MSALHPKWNERIALETIMFPPYRTNETLARNVSVDMDDTLKTKKALQHLGYYETPSYGMTRYTDNHMFDAIEKFQKDHDLKVDGVIEPDGETAATIDIALKRGGSAGNYGSKSINRKELFDIRHHATCHGQTPAIAVQLGRVILFHK